MSGWQESPNPPDSTDPSFNAKMVACIGVPGSGTRNVIDVQSANFDKGDVEISSDVATVRTHKEGLADLRSFTSDKAPTCFSKIIGRSISSELPKGIKTSGLSVKVSKAGIVPGDFDIHVSTTISGKVQGTEISKHVTLDVIGFLVGRAEVSLDIDQSAKAAKVPIEASLLHTLYTRSLTASTASD
jgi:hypothetical protein